MRLLDQRRAMAHTGILWPSMVPPFHRNPGKKKVTDFIGFQNLTLLYSLNSIKMHKLTERNGIMGRQM